MYSSFTNTPVDKHKEIQKELDSGNSVNFIIMATQMLIEVTKQTKYINQVIITNLVFCLLMFTAHCQYRNIKNPTQVIDKIALFVACILLIPLVMLPKKSNCDLRQYIKHSILFITAMRITYIVIITTFIFDIRSTNRSLYKKNKKSLIVNTIALIIITKIHMECFLVIIDDQEHKDNSIYMASYYIVFFATFVMLIIVLLILLFI